MTTAVTPHSPAQPVLGPCFMTDTTARAKFADRAADATPVAVARRLRQLSDRSIAWLFIAPTIVLLLAINIFPLIWTIYLSFTNYRANRPERRDPGRRAAPLLATS